MNKKIFFFVVTIMCSFQAVAQITTSTLRGNVSLEGAPTSAGATVIAIHTPTGTEYDTVSDSSGKFIIEGMQVGGPYSVEISFIGYETFRENGIYLKLGEKHSVTVSLKESQIQVQAVEKVVTVGEKASNFSQSKIEMTPTVSRSFYDVLKTAPEITITRDGGASILGANSRYNNFTIDGAENNDTYGLSSTGTNCGLTNANPIPLDAIKEIRVSTTSYDLRENSYTGGEINSITKSGTNEYTGTAYFYYNNQNFYSKKPSPISEQSTQVYGATLGGAIVKNKLFFFVSGEYNFDKSPSSYWVGSEGSRLSENDAITISNRFKELTGYDGGGYGPQSLKKRVGSLVARLDWNISKKHALTLRYNMLDARKEEYSSSAMQFKFNGTGYASIGSSHQIVAELKSRPTSSTYNLLRASYSRVKDGRDVDAMTPFVQISNIRDGENISVQIGTDAYSAMNGLTQNSFTITDNFSYTINGHTLTAGANLNLFNANNLYIGNGLGAYTYNSLNDFLSDNASQYYRNYPIGDPTIHLWSLRAGLFFQDEWNVSNSFTFNYGVRFDMNSVLNTPNSNEAFAESDVAQQNGFTTNTKPRTNVAVSPRIGFEWRPIQGMVIRGGAGLFSGPSPMVWITNCYSNTGTTQRGYALFGGACPKFGEEPSGSIVSNPAINLVDKKYRFPEVFRTSLSLTHDFSCGWHIGIKGVYSRMFNNLLVKNYTVKPDGIVYAVGEDFSNPANTQPHFDSSLKSSYSSIYLYTNDNRGHSYNLSAHVAKDFKCGLSLSASYTFSHSYTVQDGISAQASSIWGKTYGTNPNDLPLTWSVFDSPHKVSAVLSFSRRYHRNFGTNFSFVYQAYSGMRYSMTYSTTKDLNNDTRTGNTSIYIPTEGELVHMNFETEEQKAAFNDMICRDSYLRSHRGQYAERNAFLSPFEHHLDFHFAQDFYFQKDTNRKLQLTLDIMNLGNMFSKNWGTVYYTNDYKISPIEITNINKDVNGNYTPQYRFLGASLSKNNVLSRWHMQIGVRVVF